VEEGGSGQLTAGGGRALEGGSGVELIGGSTGESTTSRGSKQDQFLSGQEDESGATLGLAVGGVVCGWRVKLGTSSIIR